MRALVSENSAGSQELILRAALRAFAERGFDGAKTREIALDAGVNHGLIRYYFGSKPKLWKAAVDRAFIELDAALDAVMHDSAIGDDRERIGLLIRDFVRFVAQNPEFIRMMHDEGKRRGPRMRWLVDRHVRRIFDAVVELAEKASGSGLLPPDIAPLHFHYILLGATTLIFHQAEECKRLTGVDPMEDSVVDDHARAVEHILLGPRTQEESA